MSRGLLLLRVHFLTVLSSLSNIFVIGEGSKPWVSLPKGKGVKLSIAEERDQRRRLRAEQA